MRIMLEYLLAQGACAEGHAGPPHAAHRNERLLLEDAQQAVFPAVRLAEGGAERHADGLEGCAVHCVLGRLQPGVDGLPVGWADGQKRKGEGKERNETFDSVGDGCVLEFCEIRWAPPAVCTTCDNTAYVQVENGAGDSQGRWGAARPQRASASRGGSCSTSGHGEPPKSHSRSWASPDDGQGRAPQGLRGGSARHECASNERGGAAQRTAGDTGEAGCGVGDALMLSGVFPETRVISQSIASLTGIDSLYGRCSERGFDSLLICAAAVAFDVPMFASLLSNLRGRSRSVRSVPISVTAGCAAGLAYAASQAVAQTHARKGSERARTRDCLRC